MRSVISLGIEFWSEIIFGGKDIDYALCLGIFIKRSVQILIGVGRLSIDTATEASISGFCVLEQVYKF